MIRRNGPPSIAVRSIGKPAASYPAAIASDQHLAIAVDRQRTTLAATLTDAATTMTVTDPGAIVTWSLLSIDNEIVQVSGAATGNAVPITRGFDGTTPALHLAGATVAGLIDAYHHNTLVAEVEAIENALGANLSRIPAATYFTASAFAPQTPGGTLTGTPGGTTNQITLAPVPLGVNGTDSNHYLYIDQGTGTPEAVLITGGTAVSGAPSGTLFITCHNNHSGAWRIQSATGGIQEALSQACPTNGLVVVPANKTVLPVYAPVYIPQCMSWSKLSAYGAYIQAQSAFGAMIVSDPALVNFTMEGLTLLGGGFLFSNGMVNFSRPESSIRHALIDITCQAAAANSVIYQMDGCEDSVLLRCKSISHVAAPITDVVWHCPGGEIRLDRCTMFNLNIINAQITTFLMCTHGPVIADGVTAVTQLYSSYFYSTVYAGKALHFQTINSGSFDSIVMTGCYVIGSTNCVSFRGSYARQNSLIGCFFDGTGAAGCTMFSAETVSASGQPFASFILQPEVLINGYSAGTPGANIRFFLVDVGGTPLLEGSHIILGNNAGGAQCTINGALEISATNGGGGRSFSSGLGSPNGAITGQPGDIYLNASGGAGQTLWVKESGSGNTGWVGK